ncbi:hypothetical protein DSM106972_056790 [Dulcicalothrix desertica PCC 7102]|uniref:Addiction module toxin, HicA family protein n=1 Tax=Dulcicalothrix desertica PCC 7102 TaxID=232991 RepID=A0A3S1C9A8_9CYAN|nr:type II toxin-antitoxin system HicA family toxin [Dulcicalothrix desertica]RUT02759.1 hypothetical protein DSM106972_056790 [Dulcicalothrix desertica PCC 7102]TWH39006.1 HicA-like toxin of HicAB toxin-antitoxin system [Dulcicalothrix desertica PCC 7102]
MSKLPTVSGAECVKALEKIGFAVQRQRGSHITMVMSGTGKDAHSTKSYTYSTKSYTYSTKSYTYSTKSYTYSTKFYIYLGDFTVI